MGNESPDANGRDAPDGETAGADEPDETPTDESRGTDETERVLEREVSLDAGDAESLADRAVTGGQAAVPEELSAGTGRSGLSTDALFELLSSPGNRFVLTYLLRADNPTTYADLVEYVVERAEAPDDADAAFRGRVAARLVHSTLPTLADAGLVEHDGETQTVAATPAIEVAAPHLAIEMSRSADGDATDSPPDGA